MILSFDGVSGVLILLALAFVGVINADFDTLYFTFFAEDGGAWDLPLPRFEGKPEDDIVL